MNEQRESREGAKVVRVLEQAAGAARTIHAGEQVDQTAWGSRYAVLAGCLPEWAQAREMQARGPTKEVVSVVMSGQNLATRAVEDWCEQAAPAQAFARARAEEQGLLRLVMGCWRERVEHDTPGVNTDRSRGRIRADRTNGQRQTRHTQQAQMRHTQVQPTEDKAFALKQMVTFSDVADQFRWNPWRSQRNDEAPRRASTRAQRAATQEEDEVMLARWRLRGDLLRIATYYRVTGARRSAETRRRTAAAKTRFKRWAATVIAERQRREGGSASSELGGRDQSLDPSVLNCIVTPGHLHHQRRTGPAYDDRTLPRPPHPTHPRWGVRPGGAPQKRTG